MYCSGGGNGAWIEHNDQYRGIKHCYTEAPAAPMRTAPAAAMPRNRLVVCFMTVSFDRDVSRQPLGLRFIAPPACKHLMSARGGFVAPCNIGPVSYGRLPFPYVATDLQG